MSRMKKVLSLLLVLCMVFAMVPSFAMAADIIPVATFTPWGGNTATATYGIQEAAAGSYYVTTDGVADESASYTEAEATERAAGLAFGEWMANGNEGKIVICKSYTVDDWNRSPAATSTYYAGNVSNAKLELDLQSNTITRKSGSSDGRNGLYFIRVDEASELTIKNGTISWYVTTNPIIQGGTTTTTAKFSGTVTLDNVHIVKSGASACFKNRGEGTWVLNGGSITANDNAPVLLFDGNKTTETPEVYLMGGVKIKFMNPTDGAFSATKFPVKMHMVNGEITGADDTHDYGMNLYTGSVISWSGTDVFGSPYNTDAVKSTDSFGNAVWTIFAAGSRYEISIAPCEYGTVSASVLKAREGETVTLTVAADAGYELSSLTVDGQDVTSQVVNDKYSFTMPGNDVAVAATFAGIQGYHTVTIGDVQYGTVTADVPGAVAGTTVTLTVTPAAGYQVDSVTVQTATAMVEVSGNNTFIMPDGDVTVSVTFSMMRTHVVSYSDGTSTFDYYVATIEDKSLNTYISAQSAFTAARDMWKTKGTGTIKLYQDVTLSPKYNPYISVENGRSLVIDFNDKTLTYDAPSGNYRFAKLASNDVNNPGYLEFNGGYVVVSGGGSGAFLRCNDNDTAGTVKFIDCDMTKVDGAGSPIIVNGGSENLHIHFVGGVYKKINMLPTSSAQAGQVYFEGGVKIYTTSAYAVRIRDGKLHLIDAEIYTTGTSNDFATGYGIMEATYASADKFVLGTDLMPSMVEKSAQPVYDFEGTMLYKHVVRPLGSSVQQPDSIVKVGDSYFNISEFLQYLPFARDGAVITAVADINTNGVVLETSANVRYEFGTYNVAADFKASADFSIKGGNITLSVPIAISNDAVLTVSDNAVLDASTGTAVAAGTGVVLFKEAIVKYAENVEPFVSVYTEGKISSVVNANGIVTQTYTIPGDPVQGENSVVLLVESERYFDTLAEAVEAASRLSSETVQLVADTNEPALTIDKDITIDLAGFKALTEFNVNSGEVIIKNGTVASADADVIVVNGGNVTLDGLTVASVKNAVVINNGATTATITDSTLTGDSDRTNDGYALDIQAAASVAMDNVTLSTGAAEKASICVGRNVSYGNVTLTSGVIYIPKAYYEANLKWAEGQDMISALDSVSRFAYPSLVVNEATGTSCEYDFYTATVSAPAVMIGKVSYASLKEAVNQANTMSDATIVLMRDIHMDEDVNLSEASEYLLDMKKSMTIDFNGYTIYNPATDHVLFRNYSSGLTIYFKNGKIVDQCTTAGKGTIYFRYGPNITLENMYIKSATAFVTAGGTVDIKLISSTLESAGDYAINLTHSQDKANESKIQLAMTDGSRLIGQKNGLYPNNEWIDYENAIVADESYIYSTEEVANYLNITNAPSEPYKEGDYFVYYYSSTNNPVAKYNDVDYFSIGSAVSAADENGGGVVTLQKDVRLLENVSLPVGVTLDLAGYDVSFGNAGAMTLEQGGKILTNGGSIECNGQIVVKNGAIVDDYTYSLTGDALLYTALNLKAVSLSLNEYVDINLKYNAADLEDFYSVKVTANGREIAAAEPTNRYSVYKIENVKATQYAESYGVLMSAMLGNDVCVGMPKIVSVKEYAKKVVADTNQYGYSSSLGKTMTAMMAHAGFAAEFTEAAHSPAAELGTVMNTNNGTIAMTGDLSNGYEMTFTVTMEPGKTGTLTVNHKDIYGAEFTESFEVTAQSNTATYTKLHMADARQTVTATLVVDGTIVSKLLTTLASAGTTGDMALVASNHAEKLLTGN